MEEKKEVIEKDENISYNHKNNKVINHHASNQMRKESIELDRYQFMSNKVPVNILISKSPSEFMPHYVIELPQLSRPTRIVLESIRQELIKEVSLGIVDITEQQKKEEVEKKFRQTISFLISKYFPDVEEETRFLLISYLIQKSLGMGEIEILMDDINLEEITINNVNEPVYVYHKKHGWCSTSIRLRSEWQIKHYASMIGRRVGRQITSLVPLLDAHLDTGDRVNATLSPISTKGNTITIRKFARDPWTITKFIQNKTISPQIAAIIWQAVQFELSGIVAGGTASGKTSTLNVLASFIQPNQRVISIEDTRELLLPKYMHWVPMVTRLPNVEGKGMITMEDLLVNSLRMRPDRIIVGEVRREIEAQTLFEAIHTGHSVYSTFHANSASEVITRLTNPPINVPKTMIPGISFILSQFRNRRTGIRRTFELAEIYADENLNIKSNNIIQYDIRKDIFSSVSKSKILFEKIQHFSGFTISELHSDLKQKEEVLKYLVKNNIDKVDDVGLVISQYYNNDEDLMKKIRLKNIKISKFQKNKKK